MNNKRLISKAPDWKKELKKKAIGYILKDDGKPTILRIEEVIPFIEYLLKDQKEGCKDAALQIMDMPQYTGSMMARAILNTPEPSGVKK